MIGNMEVILALQWPWQLSLISKDFFDTQLMAYKRLFKIIVVKILSLSKYCFQKNILFLHIIDANKIPFAFL